MTNALEDEVGGLAGSDDNQSFRANTAATQRRLGAVNEQSADRDERDRREPGQTNQQSRRANATPQNGARNDRDRRRDRRTREYSVNMVEPGNCPPGAIEAIC